MEIQALIIEVNSERRDTMNNRGGGEHVESNYTLYDEQVNTRSPGTWVTESLASNTLEQCHYSSLGTHMITNNLGQFRPIGIVTSPSQVFNSSDFGYDPMESLTTNVSKKAITEDTIKEGDSSDSPLKPSRFPAIHPENTQSISDWKKFKEKRPKDKKVTELAVNDKEEIDLEKNNNRIDLDKEDKLKDTNQDLGLELEEFDKKDNLIPDCRDSKIERGKDDKRR